MSSNTFKDLLALKDRALEQADHIGHRLAEGTPPEDLVPLLNAQVETLAQLQSRISDMNATGWREVPGQEVQRFQKAFQHLVEVSENHLRQVSQKGIRLTGIGGKPRVPRRRPKGPPGKAR